MNRRNWAICFEIFCICAIGFFIYSAQTTDWKDCKKAVLDKWLFTDNATKYYLYGQCMNEPVEHRGDFAEVYPGVIILSFIMVSFMVPVYFAVIRKQPNRDEVKQ